MSSRTRRSLVRSPAHRLAALAVALLFAALGGPVSACRRVEPAQAQAGLAAPRVRVSAVRVRIASVAEPIRATGSLIDDRQLELGFAMGGVVQTVAFEEGMRFRRGDELARLEVDAVDAQLAQARAGLEKARRDLARVSTLRASGALSAQPEEDARTGRDVARAQVRQARFAREHSVLIAPDDGIVLRRLADPGETRGAGMPVLVLALATAGRVARLRLADREVVRVSVGDSAEVTLDAFPGRMLSGTVQTVSAAPDPQTGLYDVELFLGPAPELSERAVAGLIARATIAPSDRRSLALVPIDALVEADDDVAGLWALDDANRPTRRDVRIAFLLGTDVAISEGLEGVSRVVADGAPYVRSGSVLEVAP